jgi:hypothetical protein
MNAPVFDFGNVKAFPDLNDLASPEGVYSSLRNVSRQIANLIDYHRKNIDTIVNGDVKELVEMGIVVDKGYHLRMLHDLTVSKNNVDSSIGVLEKYNEPN